jgi:RNA polymerase sigma-B factor
VAFSVCGGDMAHLSGNLDDENAAFVAYVRTHDPLLREQLIVRYVGLASYLARRFRPGGDQLDDLLQVAVVGLIKAIDRFDPARGASFTSYAVPTILGEIRHFYRDLEQTIVLPRRLQELRARADAEMNRLSQQLERTPSDAEIAAALDESASDVAAAREDVIVSLDSQPIAQSQGQRNWMPSAGADSDMQRGEDRALIAQILSRLSPRERIVLYLRFYVGLSQSEVAGRLGISQMQVSRLQHRSLEKVRHSIEPQP